MIDRIPSESDSWLHHVIIKAEVCPDKKKTCGIWHYAITRSIRTSSKVEISGRMLSLITNGIESAANEAASKLRDAKFRGIVFETIEAVRQTIGDFYSVTLDPCDEDAAHAYLEHRAYNASPGGVEAFLVSAEVVRLHNAFTFAPPGSGQLEALERKAGAAA